MCRKALERTDARVLRLMFCMAPWERPMTYTEGETESEAQRKDEVLKSFFARAQALLTKFDPVSCRLAMKWLVRSQWPIPLAMDCEVPRHVHWVASTTMIWQDRPQFAVMQTHTSPCALE